MKSPWFVFLSALALFACQNRATRIRVETISEGQMPAVVKDEAGNIHLVYGHGDSILYSYSFDQGRKFTVPVLIFRLPHLAASHMRGPQITSVTSRLIVTACNSAGDIYSFSKNPEGEWLSTGKINDVAGSSKEGLMALSGNGNNAFAIWLDLRNGHNQIFGSKSIDGGRTWSRNILVYASPDSSVCECCKPSLATNGNNVFVMFRNWLHGDRDLYLVRSSDGGSTFENAQKLGLGSWALNGCPMDGGAISLDRHGDPKTIWNRKGVIYRCEPAGDEQKIGVGSHCTIELSNDKEMYGWVEKGKVVVIPSEGERVVLGSGDLPVLKALPGNQVLCVWEHNNYIRKAIL